MSDRIKVARSRAQGAQQTYRSRTQCAQREPPYARETDFLVFDSVAYLRGRSAGMPASRTPQSPQRGPLAFFCRY